jgi:hypothetical protein
MKFLTMLVAMAAALVLAEGKRSVIDFEKAEVGKLPAGFTSARTGPGGEGKWVVREEKGAPSGTKVLAQTDPEDVRDRYPLCIHDDLTAKDLTVSVAFKAVSGETDQAAGIVARYGDKDNYYIARANSLENNVRLYKVEKGKRIQFGGKNIEVPAAKWHTLELKVVGGQFTVSMNGEVMFTAEDGTFSEAGKVGLWTKADSVMLFDDLTISVMDGGQ